LEMLWRSRNSTALAAGAVSLLLMLLVAAAAATGVSAATESAPQAATACNCGLPSASLLQVGVGWRQNVSGVPMVGEMAEKVVSLVQRPRDTKHYTLPIVSGRHEKLPVIHELATSVPLTEGGYRMVSAKRRRNEMSIFVRRVLRKLGLRVVRRTGLIQFLYTIEQRKLSFQSLMKQVAKQAMGPDAWAILEDAEDGAVSFPGSAGMHAPVLSLGGRTSLTEEGYRKVAACGDDAQMKLFVQRAAKDLGYYIIDDMALDGMVAEHSGRGSKTTFDALERELRLAARQSRWVSITASKSGRGHLVEVLVVCAILATLCVACGVLELGACNCTEILFKTFVTPRKGGLAGAWMSQDTNVSCRPMTS